MRNAFGDSGFLGEKLYRLVKSGVVDGMLRLGAGLIGTFLHPGNSDWKGSRCFRADSCIPAPPYHRFLSGFRFFHYVILQPLGVNRIYDAFYKHVFLCYVSYHLCNFRVINIIFLFCSFWRGT